MRRTLEGLQNPGVQIACEENLADLEYADDIVLIFDEEKAQVFLDELIKVIPSFGMHFAPTKPSHGVYGVRVALSPKAERGLLDWIPVNSRLRAVRLAQLNVLHQVASGFCWYDIPDIAVSLPSEPNWLKGVSVSAHRSKASTFPPPECHSIEHYFATECAAPGRIMFQLTNTPRWILKTTCLSMILCYRRIFVFRSAHEVVTEDHLQSVLNVVPKTLHKAELWYQQVCSITNHPRAHTFCIGRYHYGRYQQIYLMTSQKRTYIQLQSGMDGLLRKAVIDHLFYLTQSP
ncbi:hypothetical protein CLF_105930 [Clonorchis sinensis]|uniref:Reverse transcriptase domain-containing protein n=1 Tax=Clonorchis sinensis TaxID=79923 RepID=G7YEF4_CLOSI|nr:hypothetical protein CLF_105930 [Clonorchis sinensis]